MSSPLPRPGASALAPDDRQALAMLTADLRRIFGVGLHALVVYGSARHAADEPLRTLALVERVTFEHLAACAPVTDAWRRAGLAVPLLLGRDEFARTLDIFPLEYHAIISDHVVVEGADPFEGLRVAESDRRRACEQLAKSHLIHLREGFLEGSREPRDVGRLIASSAPGFRGLLVNIAQLDGGGASTSDEGIAADAERTIGVPARIVLDVLTYERHATAAADPTALIALYLAAIEQIWTYVDAWRRG